MIKKLSSALMLSLMALNASSALASVNDNNIDTQSPTMDEMSRQIQELKTRVNNLTSFVYEDTQVKGDDFEAFPSSLVPLSIAQAKNDFGSAANDHRALVVGGYFEMDPQYWYGSSIQSINTANKNSVTNYRNGGGIFVTNANLDVMANLTNWLQTYLTINGTGAGTIDVQNAFFNVGNLDAFPMLFTMGKYRMPMGTFAGGGPWIAGLSQGYFRPTQTVNSTLTYSDQKLGLSSSITFFAPQLTDANGKNQFKPDFMYSVFYHDDISQDFSFGLDGSYLFRTAGSGIAAAQKYVANGATTNNTERNAVGTIEGNVAYQGFQVLSGLSSTLYRNAFSYAENGKLSGAWYVQTNYTLSDVEFLGHTGPTVFSLAYNQSYNAQKLPFNLVGGDSSEGLIVTAGVRQEVVVYVQRQIMNHFNLGLEYGYLKMYDNKHTNAITLDTSIYF